MKKLFTFSIVSLIAVFAIGFQTPPDNKDEQYLLYPNELINGGGENGTANWSATGGTLTATTMSGNVRLGLRAIEWEPTAAAQTLSTNSWVVPQAATGNGLAKFFYKTSATDDIMAVMSGASTLAYQSITSNTVDFQEHKLNFAALAGSTITATVVSQSNSEKINVDGGYLGYADNLLELEYDSGWIDGGTMEISATTTAPTKGSATIVIDKVRYKRSGSDMRVRIEYRHSAAGTATAGSGDYLWKIPGGYLIDTTKVTAYSTVEGWGSSFQNSNVVGTCQGGNGTNQIFGRVSVYDSQYVRCFAEDGASNAQGAVGSGGQPLTGSAQYYVFDFTVPIQGWGPLGAVKADQTDFGWRSYTPTITGTTSNPTEGTGAVKSAQYRRKGENMEIRFTYRHTGAGSAGSGAYLFPLPSGYTMDTTKISLPSTSPDASVAGFGGSIVGSGVNGNTSNSDANYFVSMRMAAYDSTRLYAIGDAASGAQVKTVGSTAAVNYGNASFYLSFYASVPISGWQENQRAPTLVGSVTSSSSNALRLETARLNCDASSAITAQSGSMVSSIGNISSGACQVNFTSGQFSSAPYCFAKEETGASGDPLITGFTTAPTTSAVTIDCSDNAGSDCTAYDFELMCVGAR